MVAAKSLASLIICLIFSIQGSMAQSIHFEKVKKMPVPVFGTLAVAGDNKIYVLGGKSYYDEKSYVLVYHTRLNSWLDVSDSFEHFDKGGIASAAYLKDYGSLLITGNSLVDDAIKTISVFYDVEKYKPSVVLENPYNSFFQSSTHYEGVIYFWGGHKPFENSTLYEGSSSNFYFLDPSTLSFADLPDMPIEAASKGLIIENKLYLVGGTSMVKTDLEFANEALWNNYIYTFDFDRKEWDLFTELPNSIQNFTIASFGSYLFLLYNREKSITISVVDLRTKKMSQVETKINVRDYSSIVTGDHLYIMGGRKADSPTKMVFRVSCSDLIQSSRNEDKVSH